MLLRDCSLKPWEVLRLTRTQLRAYKKLFKVTEDDMKWLEFEPEEEKPWIAETLKKYKEACDRAGIKMPEVEF